MARIAFLFPLAACLLQAQNMPPTEAGQHRPAPPILTALDANQNGVIEATELANTATALKKLDKNGDGRLTPDEYRPQRPDGGGAGARSGGRSNDEQRRPEDQSGPNARGSRDDEQKHEGQPRPQGADQQRPRPPLDLALDVNGDEIIDAGEIANAPSALKQLDANGDGKLTREEYSPKQVMKQGGQGASSR